jgi:hypothetical protein
MKENLHINELLRLPIDQLDLTPACIAYSMELGFKTLEEAAEKGWGYLQAMEGFNYIWFNEIVRFLGRYDLLNLLEAGPDE